MTGNVEFGKVKRKTFKRPARPNVRAGVVAYQGTATCE
jgi:hypothetical protein